MIKKIIYSFVLSIISLSVFAAEQNSYKGKDFYMDLNVGIASHDTGVTAVSGTTLDEDDVGYMLNVGRRMGQAWSLEGMYYDMGAASLTGSVNDTFVMKAWCDANNAGKDIIFLADGNAALSTAIGLTFDGSMYSLGIRSQRFAMILTGLKVEKIFIEKPGVFDVSSAPKVLASLM